MNRFFCTWMGLAGLAVAAGAQAQWMGLSQVLSTVPEPEPAPRPAPGERGVTAVQRVPAGGDTRLGGSPPARITTPGRVGTAPTTASTPQAAPVRSTRRSRETEQASLQVTPRVFLFEGNASVSTRELAVLVAPWVGKPLDFQGLSNVVDIVRDHYHRRGYVLASAWLPEQQVSSGVIRIAIQEGRLGQVRLRQPLDARVRVTDEQVQAIIDANVREGVPVSDQQLERPLLLIEDLTGARVRSSLARSGAPGSADLDVEVLANGRRGVYNGSVEVDNFGSQATGRARLLLKTDVNGLARFGDILSVQAVVTGQKRSLFGNVGYVIPVGPDGARVGVAVGKMSYSIGGEFASLEASGEARTVEVHASYPFVRSRDANLTGRAAFENKTSSNLQGFGIRQEIGVAGIRLQLTGDMRGASSVSVASLGLTMGNVHFPDPATRAVDQSINGFKTAGGFGKLTFDGQYAAQIGPRVNLLFRGGGQLASKNLTGVEKYSLGGPDRVRGYLPGTGSGDSGLFGSGEVRVPIRIPDWLGGNLSVAGFFDIGHIQRNRRLDDTPANDRQVENGRTLASYGVGLRLGKEDRFVLRADLARAANDANAALDAGRNKVNLWVQSQFWF